MPRKPKFIHPVRALREILSEALGHVVSQVAFAKMVGVSPATIQSVELGRLKLSDLLARKMMVQFGVDPASLKKSHSKLTDLAGNPYTVHLYEYLTKSPVKRDDVLEMRDVVLVEVEALLLAANLPTKNRLRPLRLGLCDFLRSMAKDMGLETEWMNTLKNLPEVRDKLLKQQPDYLKELEENFPKLAASVKKRGKHESCSSQQEMAKILLHGFKRMERLKWRDKIDAVALETLSVLETARQSPLNEP